jgi:hypothetical protein
MKYEVSELFLPDAIDLDRLKAPQSHAKHVEEDQNHRQRQYPALLSENISDWRRTIVALTRPSDGKKPVGGFRLSGRWKLHGQAKLVDIAQIDFRCIGFRKARMLIQKNYTSSVCYRGHCQVEKEEIYHSNSLRLRPTNILVLFSFSLIPQ